MSYSNIDMVTEYFRRRLAQDFGYVDELTIYWSLNYCQGDGMAFYGKLYEDSLTKLADRLFKGAQKAAIKRICDKGGGVIEIEGRGSRYHHWNSMSVFEGEGGCDPLTPFEETTWEQFIEAIREDVQRVSRALEKEGYKILQACSPRWWWKHEGKEMDNPEWGIRLREEALSGDLQLIVQLLDEDDYNEYENGTEYDHEDVLALARGETGVCEVRVVIRDGENVIGRSQLGGVSDDMTGKYVRQVVEECIAEAKAEAMEYINSVRERFEGVTL